MVAVVRKSYLVCITELYKLVLGAWVRIHVWVELEGMGRDNTIRQKTNCRKKRNCYAFVTVVLLLCCCYVSFMAWYV